MRRGETSGDQRVYLGLGRRGGGDEVKAHRGDKGPALPLLNLGFSQMEVMDEAKCSVLYS